MYTPPPHPSMQRLLVMCYFSMLSIAMFTYHLESWLTLKQSWSSLRTWSIFHINKVSHRDGDRDGGCGLSEKIRYCCSAGVYKFKIRWSLSHMIISPSPQSSLQDDRPLRINLISLYVSTPTVPYCWLATLRSESSWVNHAVSGLVPIFPLHHVENKRHYFRVTGHLQLVCRCNISLTLTQIWENISHVYGTTCTIPHSKIHSYVSPCITISTGARSRWSLLTIFTALFWPHGF